MRLIHTTQLKLFEFTERDIPHYAILSHTWESGETSYQDFERHGADNDIVISSKILRCCSLAASEGWQYVWVDTCCIDKSSSAELTEAINSMFKWYQKAEVCYAHLADIDLKTACRETKPKKFDESRWFTRGWTLQELLAPARVVFYDCDWIEIGCKGSLSPQISKACNIAAAYLFQPMNASVAAKMSWAALRETTRTEDMAYCLLGLFNVNMPLIYGEGDKAFRRLQFEIIQTSSDQSILAWNFPDVSPSMTRGRTRRHAAYEYNSLLAPTPLCFIESSNIVPIGHQILSKIRYSITNGSISAEFYVRETEANDNNPFKHYVALLACVWASDARRPIAIRFRKPIGSNRSYRISQGRIEAIMEVNDIFERDFAIERWQFQLKTHIFPIHNESIFRSPFPTTQYSDLRVRLLPTAVDEFSYFDARKNLHGPTTVNKVQDATLSMPCHVHFSNSDGRAFYLWAGSDALKVDIYSNVIEGGTRVMSSIDADTYRGTLIYRKNGKISIQSYMEALGPGKFLWIKLRYKTLANERDTAQSFILDIDVTDIDRSRILG
ncbi:uncharacterized protein KY384_006224 [Bacidia gigantensis]|uniref:uncharacterized protein n=1 Tax=Bacidia gigantensis TaxID=2732470 RepID=UPI001D04B71D|nr:uncharacterized protein KY384_006224 [Bacidia gigantensis]KAG8529587.1 hypothetical protein KY384_006224 [Bacidia gigantensis]